MVDIVDKIFAHQGFSKAKEELTFGSLYYSSVTDSGIGKSYYWIVVLVENIDEILKKQDQWFAECKQKFNFSDFDKNTSMLVLNNYSEDFETWKKKVYKIEEDPYQFKKYVLRFTDEVKSELKRKSKDGEVTELIKLINDEETFKLYKQNHKLTEYSWYNLLYGLATKLPFLNLEAIKVTDLENLFEETKKKIEEQGLLNDYQELESKFTEEIMANIDSIELEKLLTILKPLNNEQ
ncbi:hypothetical protein JMN32_19600 [Fulvivirga sp. 29W222]|uniref:Uncharacterized protein n=1 Tax=Fulvivirga marina TaxID=2494733 RepID=A0A937FYM0_9BACT|nr:ABC-three component system middle component 1 [Fulvivirga marina]MBL6448525.1 hypothetical protein [Fulvivirga marina]